MHDDINVEPQGREPDGYLPSRDGWIELSYCEEERIIGFSSGRVVVFKNGRYFKLWSDGRVSIRSDEAEFTFSPERADFVTTSMKQLPEHVLFDDKYKEKFHKPQSNMKPVPADYFKGATVVKGVKKNDNGFYWEHMVMLSNGDYVSVSSDVLESLNLT